MKDLIKLEIQGLKRFLANKLNRKLVTVLVLFLVAAGLTHRSLDRRMGKILVEETLRRERVVSRAGAKSIESFFDLLGNSLVLLGKDLNLGDPHQDLNAFLEEWKKTSVKGVGLIDELGVRQEVSMVGEGYSLLSEKIDLTEADFFKRAKKGREGEVVIGAPTLAPGIEETVLIVPVATPIFRNGRFRGVLGSAVIISDLTKEYLEPLELCEETRVYLIRQDGMFLYASTEQMIGVNYFDGLKAIEFPGREETEWKLRQIIDSGEAGDLDVELPDQAEGGIKRFLASYTPVKLSGADEDYMLVIALPVEKARDLYKPFVANLGIGVLTMVLLGFGMTALVLLAWRVVQSDAFEDGFEQGKRHGRKKSK